MAATDRTLDAIRLKARQFVPRPGVARGLATYFRSQAKEKSVHVLLQLQRDPPPAFRQTLSGEKVRLLDPVPEHAFFAAMPPSLTLAKRLVGAETPVRWIGPIARKDKVAPWLLADGIPEHAQREDDAAELVVEFFGDVPVKRQESVLVAARAEILNRIQELNAWRVILAQKSLLRLASQDPVKWIVEIPAPAEIDNDGVRSATGVNADPVLAPTVYNLTGATVVIGQWEPNHASLTHTDFAGRITLADALEADDRSYVHDESIAANGQFDNGEGIYVDIDDSATVSPGDVRVTPVGAFPAGSTVAAGDADVGSALVFFGANERFADTVTVNFLYTPGEAIYRDNDDSRSVSIGDTRLTPVGALPAGSVVAAGDADVGQVLRDFLTNPHDHPTHVAGTAIGSGARSAALGGSANQWKGVAPGASLRSYATPIFNAEYPDAIANGVTISTNSWGSSHIHQVVAPNTGYDVASEFYDSVTSGRQSDGSPSGLAQRVLIVGSAGNEGRPERHTENVAANGLYDAGESIYQDRNDNGVVSAAVVDILVSGPAQPAGTLLVNFNQDEMHDETVAAPGATGQYNAGEGIYRDADGSRTVTVGDVRITAAAGFPAGSIVAAGELDVGRQLRQFKLWGNVRIPNSAKNTVEVANISSDADTLFQSSSRGPTDDGRIKPDVAGPGSQNGGDGGVKSAFPRDLYEVKIGTSMSTPAVAGCAALLTESYKNVCLAAGPTPDALRALLLHSAQDLTAIPNVGAGFVGPDFATGYGRVRVREAVDLVPYHLQGVANALGDTDYTVTIGAMPELKVTLVWDDPAWTANAAPSAVTGILQNDLDLLVIAPDGTKYTPWVLDPLNPSVPATRSTIAPADPIPAAALDRRNTVEQVVVDSPGAGTWTIRVTASTLNLPPQPYTLVCEALPPQVGPCVVAAGDVWMRDNVDDTGIVPSTGRMWLSPDVWNRLAPDGLTAHENPEFGQVNSLYANIRNASAVTIGISGIDVWFGAAATGLSWPEDFNYLGRIAVPNLGPAEVRQVGPLAWDPPPPTPSDHYCLYVRVTSPQDPITIAETANVGSNTSNSNNIVWRNLNVVDLLSSSTVTFLVRNIDKRDADVELAFSIPEDFLRRGEVRLGLSPELERRWPEKQRKRTKGLVSLADGYRVARAEQAEKRGVEGKEGSEAETLPPPYRITEPRVALQGLRMDPRQAEAVRLTFESSHRARSSYEVEVSQKVRGKTVGGITYVVRTARGGR
jgi:hypothetical protein